MRRTVFVILAVALLAACNRGDDAEVTTTTTSAALATTTTTTVATTAPPPGEVTTTTTGEMPGYEIIAGESSGAYVVLVEPGNYSDIDLQNVIVDVVERHAPELVHLIDSRDALDLVLKAEVTPEEQAVLDAHYYAKLTGTRLEFQGPYSNFESIQIGS